MSGFFIVEFSAIKLVCLHILGLQIWLWFMKAGMDGLILLLLSPCYKPFHGFPLLLKWERILHNLALAFFSNGLLNFLPVDRKTEFKKSVWRHQGVTKTGKDIRGRSKKKKDTLLRLTEYVSMISFSKHLLIHMQSRAQRLHSQGGNSI